MRTIFDRNLDLIALGETEKPESLIVALHGLTSNNQCMRQTLEKLTAAFPRSVVLIPNAPFALRMTPQEIERSRRKDPDFEPESARSWFDINKMSWPKTFLQTRFNFLSGACQVQGMTETAMKHYGLKEKDVVLFGMSQGGIVALYTALRMKKPPAGICIHSSMFLGCLRRPKEAFNVMMITGDQDERTMKNPSRIDRFWESHDRAVSRLARLGVQVKDLIIPGLDHRTSAESIEKAVSFLRESLAYPPASETAGVTRAPLLHLQSA